jgi:hypothetical protein
MLCFFLWEFGFFSHALFTVFNQSSYKKDLTHSNYYVKEKKISEGKGIKYIVYQITNSSGNVDKSKDGS